MEILQKYYLEEGKDITKRLPGREWTAIRAKAQKMGIVTRGFHQWSEEEENILKSNTDKTLPELKKLLPNKTDIAIKSKISTLGLKIAYAHAFWTDEENDLIRKYAPTMKWKEMETVLPGRKAQSIKAQAHKLGITHTKLWTKEEDEWLKSVYSTMDIADIAKTVGKKKEAVLVHARSIGLYKGTRRDVWDDNKIDFIKKNYGIMDRNEIAKILNIDPKQITRKAAQLGLKKRGKEEE